MKNRIIAALAAVFLILGLGACTSDADTASKNLSKAADNFEIQRRIVFYNGITESYILVVEGRCSIGNDDEERFVSITCRLGDDAFVKHHFFKSDNTVVFSEQLESADVSVNHYRVVFKPQSIVPDVDVRGGTDDLPESQ